LKDLIVFNVDPPQFLPPRAIRCQPFQGILAFLTAIQMTHNISLLIGRQVIVQQGFEPIAVAAKWKMSHLSRSKKLIQFPFNLFYFLP
jgi:hypothetical protein